MTGEYGEREISLPKKATEPLAITLTFGAILMAIIFIVHMHHNHNASWPFIIGSLLLIYALTSFAKTCFYRRYEPIDMVYVTICGVTGIIVLIVSALT